MTKSIVNMKLFLCKAVSEGFPCKKLVDHIACTQELEVWYNRAFKWYHEKNCTTGSKADFIIICDEA